MNGHETSRGDATVDADVATRTKEAVDASPPRPDNQTELEWHRAETERLRVLVDFIARPIHAPGGADPDPDVLSAYNLAVEAVLLGVRRAAASCDVRRPS